MQFLRGAGVFRVVNGDGKALGGKDCVRNVANTAVFSGCMTNYMVVEVSYSWTMSI